MRLVAGLLALTLTGSLAFADHAKPSEPQPMRADGSPAKVGLRVVRVMTESHQALLFDKYRGTHVLADVGSVIGTYVVTAIDEDEVTLTSEGRELVLTAPEPTWRRGDRDEASPAVAAKKRAGQPSPGGPGDPSAPDDADAPVAPGQGGVRVTRAPSSAPMTNPYDEATLDAANTAAPVRVASAPDAITTTEMELNPYNEPELAATDSAADPDTEPAPAPAAKSLKKGAVDDEGARAFADAMNGAVIVRGPDEAAPPAADPATIISRKELTAALGDFAGLTASVRGAFTPAGARIDVVAPGTVFAKAGLRNGDVITSVDGQPVKSIDDAADLYIRAGSAKTANVQLLRATKPMTLRLAIQ